MPYLCVTINLPSLSLQTINDNSYNPTNGADVLNSLQDILNGINAGAYAASVQVTSRNTDPGTTTDGGKSEQATYNLL